MLFGGVVLDALNGEPEGDDMCVFAGVSPDTGVLSSSGLRGATEVSPSSDCLCACE